MFFHFQVLSIKDQNQAKNLIQAKGGQLNEMRESDEDGPNEQQTPDKDMKEGEGTEMDPTKTLLRSIINSDSPTDHLSKIQFWDFGGQAGFYGTHHPFLSYRSLYLLLYDISKNLRAMVEDEDLDPSKRKERSVAGMTYHFLCL